MIGERISPIYVDDNGNPYYNNGTWALRFHLMSVDFPYGVGNSYPTAPSDYESTSPQAANTFYAFIQRMIVKYPAWFKRDIYIFGESYGGHWVPAIAYKIVTMNKALPVTSSQYINLKGIGLGDPWTDGTYQGVLYDVFSYNLGLLNRAQQSQAAVFESYISGNVSTNSLAAYNSWGDLLNFIGNTTDNVNFYNIRYYQDQDTGNIPAFLSNPVIKDLLHIPAPVVWQECNDDVNANFSADFFTGQSSVFPTLLSNIKVMIYNGQDDLIVNTIGVEKLLAGIQWSAMPTFLKTRKAQWNVAGDIAGYAMTYSNLTFVMILKAGHLAPLDQPQNVRDMVSRYIFDQGWN
jgi:Carboxypeptidase C (cathepsin A)